MVGLQLYTVRDKIINAKTARSALKAIKDIGYGCVQLAGDMNMMKLCADACVELEIPVIGILTSLSICKNQSEELFSLAKACGARDIGISAYSMTKHNEAYELVRDFNEFARKASEQGLSCSYHNHSNEFIVGECDKSLMDILLSGFDSNIDMMPDTYWLQHGGVDVRAYLETLKGRVKILHLKDMKRSVDGQAFAPLGDGNLNFPGILDVADAIGVEHYIVEQDTCECDSLICAQRSCVYIKNLLQERRI